MQQVSSKFLKTFEICRSSLASYELHIRTAEEEVLTVRWPVALFWFKVAFAPVLFSRVEPNLGVLPPWAGLFELA